MAKEKKATVVLATLYRFGYDLTVVSATEAGAKKAMKAEYVKTYKSWNDGDDPTQEELRSAMDDIGYTEMTLNKVEWL